ncbi:MAG: PINc/VapC family ATPase [Candidatus Atabeyarchaeum deiterrae]
MSAKFVVDTSIVINGMLSDLIENGELGENLTSPIDIAIPKTVLAEIEYQSNVGKTSGQVGLEELKKLRILSSKGKINLLFVGERPTLDQIRLSGGGELDEMIRNQARVNNATLLTSDSIQASIAEVEGVPTRYIAPRCPTKFLIEDYFTTDTMSVHLKENALPLAKRGRPGNWKLTEISKEPMTRQQLEEIALSSVDRARSAPDCFLEIDEPGATVVQLGQYRIAIARPPFSDGLEITGVRPLLKVSFSDYALPEQLKNRLEKRAEGVLVAGPPGAGKTTFASALAEFYWSKGKIVKTIEKPRDLQVPPEVTQYTALDGRVEKTANMLLLVRPDYCIYDELRGDEDFKIYVDLRLAGVGMVGVVHSSSAIDAIQRIMNRVSLGQLCQVIDTAIFVKDGEIKKVYSLQLRVRVPAGMREADLARPVVEVRDFLSNSIEYEIYTFSDQVIVVPLQVREREGSASRRMAPRQIEHARGVGGDSADGMIAGIAEGYKIPTRVRFSSKWIIMTVDPVFSNKRLKFYADDRPLFFASTDNEGSISLRKNTPTGEKLLRAMKEDSTVYALISQ